MSYQCQREPEADRHLRRARKVRKRLNASPNLLEPVVEKPKGMHWSTFQRLLQAEAAAGCAALGGRGASVCGRREY
jgi:hypothetical protein